MYAEVELGWIRLWIKSTEWRDEIMTNYRNYSDIGKSSWNNMLVKYL